MIDVFLSRPTTIAEAFATGLAGFMARLEDLELRPHTLGVSDYPTKAPLDEVIRMLERCRGAVIMGYPQIEVASGLLKGRTIAEPMLLPTEWNHIEAGIAYARSLPLLVIHHTGVVRGIFDRGAINSFIYDIDLADDGWALSPKVTGALRQWRDQCLAWDAAERRALQEAAAAQGKLNEASLSVRLRELDTWAGRGIRHSIVISNNGPAEAFDVDLTFPDGKTPLPAGEREDKLPVHRLPEGADYALVAAIDFECAPPFRAKLTWTDGRGTHEREYPLT